MNTAAEAVNVDHSEYIRTNPIQASDEILDKCDYQGDFNVLPFYAYFRQRRTRPHPKTAEFRS